MAIFRLPSADERSLARIDRIDHSSGFAVSPYPEAAEQDFSARSEPGGVMEYWRILRRRKGTVLLIAFLGVAAGLLLTLPQTPAYRARVSLEIQGINENFLNMRDVNPTAANIPYPPEIDLQTQVRVLQSQALLERVVGKFDGHPIPLRAGRLAAWREALGLGTSRPAPPRERLIAAAAVNLKVRAVANTRVIEILFDWPDAKFAAEFANALALEFIEQTLDSRWQMTQHTGDWLTRQMQDLKIKLEKSEEQLRNYARASGLLFTGDKERENVEDEKLRNWQQELSRAQADRVAKQSRYELATSASAEALPEVLDDKTLQEYQVKLTELRRQVAELSSSLTPEHPRVAKVQAQVDTMQAAVERARASVVRRIQNEFQAAQRRENLLKADYAAQARLVSEQAAKVTHYSILKREVDTTRQLYESMLQRVKEAGLASALRASNVRIIDPARPPKRPYKPDLLLNGVLGLLTGVMAGFGVAVMRERADRSIQEPGDISLFLNVSELGVISSIEAAQRAPRLPRARGPQRSLGALIEAPEATVPSDAAVVPPRPDSVVSDSVRAVLTSLLFCGNNGDRPRVLVISSANPEEGKTTVTTHLARALAEINLRVLLIDGDLRKSRVHEVFHTDNDRGLADVLRGGPTLQSDGVIRDVGVANLYVLPAGPSGHSTMLYSPRLPEFIRKVRAEFDMVLIDSPPMLQMPDARVLARHADAVILIVRAERTTRDEAMLACQRFSEDGTKVLGTILNDWNPKRSGSYGYYRYYGRYHSYSKQ